MGAGASSGLKAGVQASSPEELKGALAGLSDEAKAKLKAALGDSGPSWEPRYGIVGCFAIKDLEKGIEIAKVEAAEQVKCEKMAPSFTVLGSATPTTEGYPKPPEESTEDRLFWLAPFDSKEAYNHDDHMKRESRNANIGAIMDMLLTGDPMKDMVGGYMGPLLHMEKTPSVSGPVYTILVSVKAKDAKAAAEVVEINKAFAPKQLANEEGALRFTIIPPGGDMPGADSEDGLHTVRWIETWKSAADHEARKKTAHFKEVGPKINDLTTEFSVIEFANGLHFI